MGGGTGRKGDLPTATGTADLSLKVAELTLALDTKLSSLEFSLPDSHVKFSIVRSDSFNNNSPNQLTLTLQDTPLPRISHRGVALCRTLIWEMWQEEDGDYIFTTPRQLPLSLLRVAPDFRSGSLTVDSASGARSVFYPLQGIDNVLFINWLAMSGDVSLHASGIAHDGRGYIFIGPSKAGKSTLVRGIKSVESSVTVLGEDQLFLRLVNGRFWVYGTPWHEDPLICSPLGVPLAKVFFLERGPGRHLEPCSPVAGISTILRTAFIPFYRKDLVPAILDRLAGLSAEVPFFSLCYQLGDKILKTIIYA